MSPKRPAKKKYVRNPSRADRGGSTEQAPPANGTENRKQPKSGPRVDPNDPVEEASWESFPASDPPSFNPAPKKRPARDD
jgi:hypothetical protein